MERPWSLLSGSAARASNWARCLCTGEAATDQQTDQDRTCMATIHARVKLPLPRCKPKLLPHCTLSWWRQRYHWGVSSLRASSASSVSNYQQPIAAGKQQVCTFLNTATLLLHTCRHGPHEEEEVVYERLPSDIAERFVLLLDPLVGTGRTACRAVQVSGLSSWQ